MNLCLASCFPISGFKCSQEAEKLRTQFTLVFPLRFPGGTLNYKVRDALEQRWVQILLRN